MRVPLTLQKEFRIRKQLLDLQTVSEISTTAYIRMLCVSRQQSLAQTLPRIPFLYLKPQATTFCSLYTAVLRNVVG